VIDERAIIHPTARVAQNVTIGPWAYIGENVSIDEGTVISPHVVIKGPTTIGKNNRIFQFASIGEQPQDKKYDGENTELIIGDDNVIREYCNFNRGTVHGGGVTKIGSRNLFMANVHIAHDCIIGNNIIMANNTSIAGHVTIKDFAILSGYIGIHQFCLIGEYSFLSHGMLITQDVPPYMMVAGERRKKVSGINTEGLRRHQFSPEAIRAIKETYKILYMRNLPLEEATSQLVELAKAHPELERVVNFIEESKRGLLA
jgi:UDP-N-acetylglucosamine acyltransferase